jgi:hypothetical protein
MKKILILLTSMLLLSGCMETVAIIGGGASNGKLIQTTLQTSVSYGMKKATGKTPVGHTLSYLSKNKTLKKEGSCSSFANKKDLEICLMVKKRIVSKQAKVKEKELADKALKELTSSLQSSINMNSKIKYLDQ